MLAPWAQEQVLTWLFTTGAMGTRPTAWFLALHTGDPGTGADNEVTSGADANYARQSVDLTVALVGNQYEADTDADVTFPAAETGASYTVTHVSMHSAVTAGDALLIKAVPIPIPVVGGGVVSIPLGELIIQGGQ